MKIYLSNKVNCIKKFDSSMYIYTGESNYRVAQPIQSLVDLYIKGISEFDIMLQALINEYQIEGALDDVRSIIINAQQFRDVFTFENCNKVIKVFGEYGERFPNEIHIELTNACNLNCPHCYKKANEGDITFLDFDALKVKLFDICNGKTQVLHLTGGEPSLHPDFTKMVDYISEIFHVQLTTNGANLWKIPVSTIRKISDIDISMYGTEPKSYEENTGNLYAYNDFEKSCGLLSENKIDFRINMIVNHKNITKLDEYVVKAIELGATSFSFGVPTKTGRLIESPNKEWNCNSDMTNYIYRYMRKAREKYEDKINIVEWKRDVYTRKGDIFSNGYALPCKGGTFSWWMNEKMEFRPCAMIPEQYILLSYREWIDYCNNRFNINWGDCYLNLEQYCSSKELDPVDICYVFNKNNV